MMNRPVHHILHNVSVLFLKVKMESKGTQSKYLGCLDRKLQIQCSSRQAVCIRPGRYYNSRCEN